MSGMNIATLAWLMSSAVSCRPVTPSKSLRICVPSLRHRCLSGFCRLAFSRRGSLGMKIAFSGASTLSCLQVLCPYYLGTGQLTGQLHGPSLQIGPSSGHRAGQEAERAAVEAWDWLRSPRHHLVVEAEHFAHPLLKPSSPSEGLQDKLGTGWHTRAQRCQVETGSH